MALDERPYEAEPDAEAALRPGQRLRRLREEIEDPLEKVRRDPVAVVPHAQDRLAALFTRLTQTCPSDGVYFSAF